MFMNAMMFMHLIRFKSWLIMFLIMRLDLIQFGLNQVLIKSWPVYDLSAGLDAIMPK